MAEEQQEPQDDGAADLARLAVALAGVALISYGAWLVYVPAGFITCGAMLLGSAVLGTLRARG
jgi:hypothetical protein